MTPDEYNNLIEQAEHYTNLARQALDMVIEINHALIKANQESIKLVIDNEN